MSDPRGSDAKLPETPPKRRALLIGASAAGVGVIAARALAPAAPEAALAAAAPQAAEATGGYRLTAHVLRYYETARA